MLLFSFFFKSNMTVQIYEYLGVLEINQRTSIQIRYFHQLLFNPLSYSITFIELISPLSFTFSFFLLFSFFFSPFFYLFIYIFSYTPALFFIFPFSSRFQFLSSLYWWKILWIKPTLRSVLVVQDDLSVLYTRCTYVHYVHSTVVLWCTCVPPACALQRACRVYKYRDRGSCNKIYSFYSSDRAPFYCF